MYRIPPIIEPFVHQRILLLLNRSRQLSSAGEPVVLEW